MVRVSEIRGRYAFEGRAYGPFQPSRDTPFIEVPENLARALNLPLYESKAEAPKTKPKHEKQDESQQEKPESQQDSIPNETETPLPDDFPMHSALVGGGLTTLEAVTAATDEQLKAIDGIGDKTIERIREALK